MSRQTEIVLVILTSVLCGLPGLALLCLGSLGVIGVLVPETDASLATPERAGTLTLVLGAACLGVIGILIPLLTGFFSLRIPKKPVDLNEPIPPPG